MEGRQRMTEDQLKAAKVAAKDHLKELARLCGIPGEKGGKKFTWQEIADSKKGGGLITALNESPVGYGFCHLAASRGMADPVMVFSTFNTRPGTQMAVGALIEVREKTGKEIGWFNSAAINAMLASLSEIELGMFKAT